MADDRHIENSHIVIFKVRYNPILIKFLYAVA